MTCRIRCASLKSCHHDIMSFHDMMMSSPMHVQQVMRPFGIKGATLSGGMVLLPKAFKRLDPSKCAQVAMSQVHPCDWSLLPSTVLSVFTCVLFCYTCSDTHSCVPGKPRSTAHSSTSTTSTALLCLSVGALVHYIYGRSCK